MLQVTCTITVGENAQEGSMITIIDAETVPALHEDTAGLFIQVGQVIERLSDDVLKRALDQAKTWAEMVER